MAPLAPLAAARLPIAPGRRRAGRGALAVGGALFAALALAALAGPALRGVDPRRQLDPAYASLLPPGTRVESVELADGRTLAAPRIEREGEALRLHGRPGEPIVPLAERAALGLIEAAQAFPRLFLLVALAAITKPGWTPLVLLLGLTGWMPVARLVRAEVRTLAGRDFVLAARATGVGPLRLALRHLLPNALAPVAIEGSLGAAAAIVAEATLSFLGLGLPPPAASWGGMIADGRDALATAWWVSVFPGLALVAAALAFNLIGEGLRDRLDPRALRLEG